MKLLTPSVASDLKGQEIARDILRVKEVEKVVKDANYRLAKSEADFANFMASKHKEWEVQEASHRKDIDFRTKEIEELEARRAKALIPIEVYKKQADTMLEEARSILDSVKLKEERLDQTQEILENRLDQANDHESSLNEWNQELERKAKGIEHQAAIVSADAARLVDETSKFYEYKLKQEESLNKRKTEVALAEISVNAKLDKVLRDINANDLLAKKIRDDRATLDRAFERLNKQKNGKLTTT